MHQAEMADESPEGNPLTAWENGKWYCIQFCMIIFMLSVNTYIVG